LFFENIKSCLAFFIIFLNIYFLNALTQPFFIIYKKQFDINFHIND